MATAIARPLHTAARGSRAAGVAPVALRLARTDPPVDLDAAWQSALAPHRIADQRDARIAQVIPLRRRRSLASASARVRRHRLVAVVAVVGLAVALALATSTIGADADAPGALGTVLTVQPGQTLWDLAAQHTPAGDDVRVTLDEIRRLNGLTGADVPAWTSVVLPAS